MPLYAKRSGADIVIINVGPTEQDPIADIIIDAPAGKTMTKIVERLRSVKSE
jgi:NAD-dependent deacetylase